MEEASKNEKNEVEVDAALFPSQSPLPHALSPLSSRFSLLLIRKQPCVSLRPIKASGSPIVFVASKGLGAVSNSGRIQ
jgi:hypothetical protein